MTVAELLDRMSSAELSEWIAFHRIEPLPDGYWCAAQISRTVLGSITGKASDLADFLPQTDDDQDDDPQAVSARDLARFDRAFAGLMIPEEVDPWA